MHEPGVIPLRPLTVSDIFGGALRTMRRNPDATVGLGLLVMAVTLVPSMLVTLALPYLTRMSLFDAQTVGVLLPSLLASLATFALTGLVVHVVSEAALGTRTSIAQTWRAVRGRLLALAGVLGLLFLVSFVTVALLALTVVLFTAGPGAELGTAGQVLAVVLTVVVGLPLWLWLTVRLSLATAAVVLERLGPAQSLARSWRLTSGAQGWRVLGITVLVWIVTTIAGFVVIIPIALLPTLAIEFFIDDPATAQSGQTIVDHVLEILINALITPFTAGVTALLYLDQRIRREGLDMAMMRAAHERATHTRPPHA